MSENLFSILLFLAGFFGSILQIFVSHFCFALIARNLIGNAVSPTKLGFNHLFGYSAAALLSGGFFIGIILLVVHWVNNFPEWTGRKYFFWIGFVGGLVISRIIGGWRNRHK